VSGVEAALREIAKRLDDLGREWAVIGGLAVSARADPRLTRDVDIAVVVANDSDAESLVFDLQSSGYVLEAMLEQTSTSRLATVRLRKTGRKRGAVTDLLFASSGIEAEVVAGAELLEVIPGLTIPVASVGHLIALKVLARDDRNRPQDYDDLRALLAIASAEDIADARTALRLIEARQSGRGRPLEYELEALLKT
jgi:predicted nucleotidyltransferase